MADYLNIRVADRKYIVIDRRTSSAIVGADSGDSNLVPFFFFPGTHIC